ncbi:MAG: hypothetical protein GEV12_00270 [Micromonosporaceae bacterium]|nr:hypothetical protein [Micromonosporaceae bacterium]
MTADDLAPLAEYASALRFDELPKEVVEATRLNVLNNLACAFLGSSSPGSEQLRSAPEWFGTGQGATIVLGRPAGTQPMTAAFTHAAYINATELSEGVSKAVVHTGTVIIPAVMAAAEQAGSQGKDVVAAIVAGYEVLIRVGWALAHVPGTPDDTVQAQSLHRGWYPPAVLGGFGVVAALGNLRGQTGEQILDAMGTFANIAPTTLLASFRQGVMAKGLGCGVASASGMMCTELAGSGFTGVRDAARKLFPLLVDEVDYTRLTDGLGERYETLSLDVKFAGAGPVLADIECMFQLIDRLGPVDIDRITQIDVHTNRRALLLNDPRPQTPTAAKFSGPYCLAQVLLGRSRNEMMVEAFTAPIIENSNWEPIAGKVRMHLDEEFDRDFESVPPRRRPSRIVIAMNDGATLEHMVTGAMGLPMMPAPPEAYISKFRYLVEPRTSASQTDEIVSLAMDLDQLDDAGQVMRACGSGR